MISRIRGDVEVRYVRWVSELNRGKGELVSSATDKLALFPHSKVKMQCIRTSSVIQLRRDADARPILGGERKVGLPHIGKRVSWQMALYNRMSMCPPGYSSTSGGAFLVVVAVVEQVGVDGRLPLRRCDLTEGYLVLFGLVAARHFRRARAHCLVSCLLLSCFRASVFTFSALPWNNVTPDMTIILRRKICLSINVGFAFDVLSTVQDSRYSTERNSMDKAVMLLDQLYSGVLYHPSRCDSASHGKSCVTQELVRLVTPVARTTV